MVAAFAAAGQRWIIEGVYGWLAEAALFRATTLIWLDMPWSLCRESLAQRGPWRGATAEQHGEFLSWAEHYWQRRTSTSYDGHLGLFEGFMGDKLRIRDRSDIGPLLNAKQIDGIAPA
ncbi:AAA family ATPase [Rhodopseudomonas sp. P2A-2r]|uniref:AAA family ATPase n=1 Tax=unclassified Rhodopseudomonas TaxID=2638247 RepID=UPI00223428F9|nr:AAA family ATPase [Rhodopseudomonas sp. P2A-2r]UZE48210.1 AAA family ATPase [Rhodopseudomonas sp. P2A-2r]